MFASRVWGPGVGILSLIYLSTRQTNADLSDSLHCYPFNEATRFLAFYLIVRLAEQPASNKWLAAVWGALFLNASFSFFSILELQVLLWGTLLFAYQVPFRKPFLLLALAPVVAFGLHQGFNAFSIGFGNYWNDISTAFVYRTVGLDSSPQDELSQYLPLLVIRFKELAGIPFLCVLLLILALWGWRKTGVEGRATAPTRKEVGVLIFLALSGVTWWVAFPSFTRIHYFVFRHILPFLAALVGLNAWLAGRTPAVSTR